MNAWVETKVGPWRVYTFTDETVKNLRVGGKPVAEPFKFLIAISWIGDMEVELIQPVYGPTIYERFLQGRARACTTSRRRSPMPTWVRSSRTMPLAASR